MPVEQEAVLTISCDNPACPGNDLAVDDRTGWLFINSEVYGQPTQQSVFCTLDCLNAATGTAPELFVAPAPEPEAAPA